MNFLTELCVEIVRVVLEQSTEKEGEHGQAASVANIISRCSSLMVHMYIAMHVCVLLGC